MKNAENLTLRAHLIFIGLLFMSPTALNSKLEIGDRRELLGTQLDGRRWC